VAGSGYASAINQWLMLAGLALCTHLMRGLVGLRLLRSALAASRSEMAKILRLGLPIGGMIGVEVGVFLAAGILIGLLGTAALGAHQLVLNCASITFMVPLGLGQAATVRVAYELGAGREFAARRAGFVALALGIGFMSATAVVLWTIPQAIIAVYVDVADPANREVVVIARRLLAIAAIFQVFDGMQVIAACALRGYRDTLVPMLLGSFGYWGAGFLGGCLLAFPLGYSAVGLWWGLALGLAVVAVLLTLRLYLLGGERRGGTLTRLAALGTPSRGAARCRRGDSWRQIERADPLPSASQRGRGGTSPAGLVGEGAPPKTGWRSGLVDANLSPGSRGGNEWLNIS
jgi:multidrug resistance protein, MATE family